MPRGKRYCPYESEYFSAEEFRVVGSTEIHDVEPRHRSRDGLLVHVAETLEPFPAVVGTTLTAGLWDGHARGSFGVVASERFVGSTEASDVVMAPLDPMTAAFEAFEAFEAVQASDPTEDE